MLPRILRLSTDYDFRRVKRAGKGVTTSLFGLYYSPRSLSQKAPSRFGIIVTNRLDKRAVYRNRVRRLLRQVIYENRERVRTNFDVVVVAFNPIMTATYEKISNTFNTALSKTPLL